MLPSERLQPGETFQFGMNQGGTEGSRILVFILGKDGALRCGSGRHYAFSGDLLMMYVTAEEGLKVEAMNPTEFLWVPHCVPLTCWKIGDRPLDNDFFDLRKACFKYLSLAEQRRVLARVFLGREEFLYYKGREEQKEREEKVQDAPMAPRVPAPPPPPREAPAPTQTERKVAEEPTNVEDPLSQLLQHEFLPRGKLNTHQVAREYIWNFHQYLMFEGLTRGQTSRGRTGPPRSSWRCKDKSCELKVALRDDSMRVEGVQGRPLEHTGRTCKELMKRKEQRLDEQKEETYDDEDSSSTNDEDASTPKKAAAENNKVRQQPQKKVLVEPAESPPSPLSQLLAHKFFPRGNQNAHQIAREYIAKFHPYLRFGSTVGGQAYKGRTEPRPLWSCWNCKDRSCGLKLALRGNSKTLVAVGGRPLKHTGKNCTTREVITEEEEEKEESNPTDGDTTTDEEDEDDTEDDEDEDEDPEWLPPEDEVATMEDEEPLLEEKKCVTPAATRWSSRCPRCRALLTPSRLLSDRPGQPTLLNEPKTPNLVSVLGSL